MSEPRLLPVGIEITFLWLSEDPEIYFVVSNGRNALEVKLFKAVEDVLRFADLLTVLSENEIPLLTQRSFSTSRETRFDNGLGRISAFKSKNAENYEFEACLQEAGQPDLSKRFSVTIRTTKSELNRLGDALTEWLRGLPTDEFKGEQFVFFFKS